MQVDTCTWKADHLHEPFRRPVSNFISSFQLHEPFTVNSVREIQEKSKALLDPDTLDDSASMCDMESTLKDLNLKHSVNAREKVVSLVAVCMSFPLSLSLWH